MRKIVVPSTSHDILQCFRMPLIFIPGDYRRQGKIKKSNPLSQKRFQLKEFRSEPFDSGRRNSILTNVATRKRKSSEFETTLSVVASPGLAQLGCRVEFGNINEKVFQSDFVLDEKVSVCRTDSAAKRVKRGKERIVHCGSISKRLYLNELSENSSSSQDEYSDNG